MPCQLTIDDYRSDADRTYRTHDGFLVRVTAREDLQAAAEYPGSPLNVIHKLCPGLVEEFDFDPIPDLPQSRRFVYSSRHIATRPINSTVARSLLIGRQRNRIPLRVIAEIASAWEEVDDASGQHINYMLDGMEEITVCVYRRGRLILRRSLSGIYAVCDRDFSRRFEHDTVEEARALHGMPPADEVEEL